MFPGQKLVVENLLKTSFDTGIIFGKADGQDGMRLPFRFQLFDRKSLEKFLFPFEICLYGGKQQALAEASGP